MQALRQMQCEPRSAVEGIIGTRVHTCTHIPILSLKKNCETSDTKGELEIKMQKKNHEFYLVKQSRLTGVIQIGQVQQTVNHYTEVCLLIQLKDHLIGDVYNSIYLYHLQ